MLSPMAKPTPGFFPVTKKSKITLDPTTLNQLANDLAKEARELKDVLADYGLTEEEYHHEVEHIPYYKKVLDEATRAWHAPMNTKARVELGSLTYFETVMPSIAKGAMDEKQPLNARTDAARLLASVSGMTKKEQSANESAERFVIQINMGEKPAEKITKTIELPALPKTQNVD